MPEGQRCGPGCGCGLNTFSTRDAEDDLRRYREQGPDRTTRKLIEAIKAEGIEGASLLDVGGGIGAIPLELLAAGLGTVQSVDASEGYLAVATAEAARRGFGDRASHRLGAFQDLAAEVGPADVVTLDRVVCCDENAAALLAAVTSRARRMVGLVYPRVTWWNKVAAIAMNAVAWVRRDLVRWYLHPEANIDDLLRRAGFVRRDVGRSFVWQVALYVRPSPAVLARAAAAGRASLDAGGGA